MMTMTMMMMMMMTQVLGSVGTFPTAAEAAMAYDVGIEEVARNHPRESRELLAQVMVMMMMMITLLILIIMVVLIVVIITMRRRWRSTWGSRKWHAPTPARAGNC
jgi:NADH:ubiquinone oxidoreductase subunit 5 (subunit L)/multisubunit Na+/H+ antiporter MnhA subunit